MATSTQIQFFLLRAGASQEERWGWDEIASMCEAGELTADAQVFFAEDNAWRRIADTELAGRLPAGSDTGTPSLAANETLREDYEQLLERLSREGPSVDALIEAARYAVDLEDRPAARSHFQAALDLAPFHPRVAQEIRRRFSKSECHSFRCMDRPRPVWDDVSELLEFTLSRGPLYLVVAAILLAGISLIPHGAIGAALLAFLWGTQMVRGVAAGQKEARLWGPAVSDPVGELLVPAGVATVSIAMWSACFAGVARLAMLIDKKSVGAIDYVASSPLFVVAIALIVLAYYPAVVVMISRSQWRAAMSATLPWKVAASAMRMGHEYALSLLLLGVLVFACGVVKVGVSALPFIGTVISSFVIALVAPAAALVVGRLAARMHHVLR